MENKNFKYKEALARIDAILNLIENNEPDLDELNTLVKEALTLIKLCKDKLKNTESELSQAIKEID
ncbi:hypothetical protein BH23BAC1_BH23BAC1_16610 [soil metagenome]